MYNKHELQYLFRHVGQEWTLASEDAFTNIAINNLLYNHKHEDCKRLYTKAILIPNPEQMYDVKVRVRSNRPNGRVCLDDYLLVFDFTVYRGDVVVREFHKVYSRD